MAAFKPTVCPSEAENSLSRPARFALLSNSPAEGSSDRRTSRAAICGTLSQTFEFSLLRWLKYMRGPMQMVNANVKNCNCG